MDFDHFLLDLNEHEPVVLGLTIDEVSVRAPHVPLADWESDFAARSGDDLVDEFALRRHGSSVSLLTAGSREELRTLVAAVRVIDAVRSVFVIRAAIAELVQREVRVAEVRLETGNVKIIAIVANFRQEFVEQEHHIVVVEIENWVVGDDASVNGITVLRRQFHLHLGPAPLSMRLLDEV